MEQTRALNALEPFLALSKSANSPRAAADLITQATSAPNTYVFAELLHTPNIQALRQSPDFRPYLHLLEIFSWGTWSDYNENAAALPSLSPAQQTKLRLLSLLPLARSHSTLTYPHLLNALALSSPRALEDLVITAVYADLLRATLDPAHQRVVVTAVAPLRDPAPGSIPAMHAALDEWGSRCETVLADLDARIHDLKATAVARERRRRERDRKLARAALDDRGAGADKDPDTDWERDRDLDSGALTAALAGVKRGLTDSAAAEGDGYGSSDAMDLDPQQQQQQPEASDGSGGGGGVMGKASRAAKKLGVRK